MSKSEESTIRGLLLAAGLGTRLRPITDNLPKCLVEIRGEPILGWWLKHLEDIGCDAVLVNKHYHADKVTKYLESKQKMNYEIVEKYEEELLGTAGTLLANKDFFKNTTVILIHADNATDTDLRQLIEAHKKRPDECVMTMLTFTTDKPQNCGIVVTDSRGVVQSFHEKSVSPPGNHANGAVYILEYDVIEMLSCIDEKPQDFSTDVLPKLVGRIYTWHTPNHFIDIGTLESLKEARRIWPEVVQ